MMKNIKKKELRTSHKKVTEIEIRNLRYVTKLERNLWDKLYEPMGMYIKYKILAEKVSY